MIFLPRRIKTCLSEEAYCSMMNLLAREFKKGQWVMCELCQKEFAASYLATHLEVQHDVRHTYGQEELCHPAPQKLVSTFYLAANKWHFPRAQLPVRAGGQWVHHGQQPVVAFWLPVPAGHSQDRGRLASVLRRLWRVDASGRHRLPPQLKECREMTDIRKRQGVTVRAAVAVGWRFQAPKYEWDPKHKTELCNMEIVKYLDRVVANDDCNIPDIRRDLKTARFQWGQLQKVIAQKVVPLRVAGMFYQAMVAAVLLYGSKTWCLPDTVRRPLEGFHAKAGRRLTSMRPKVVKGE